MDIVSSLFGSPSSWDAETDRTEAEVAGLLWAVAATLSAILLHSYITNDPIIIK